MMTDWIGWLMCAAAVVVWVALSHDDETRTTYYKDCDVDELENDCETLGLCFPCDGDTMTVGCE